MVKVGGFKIPMTLQEFLNLKEREFQTERLKLNSPGKGSLGEEWKLERYHQKLNDQ